MSSPDSPQAKSGAGSSAGKKNFNKNRAKARAQFDSSAPLIPLDRYFSDFQEIRRNNVCVELDNTLVDRLAAPYIDKASDFAGVRGLDFDAKVDLTKSTYALVGFTLIRKLIKSAPNSVANNLSPFKFISDVDLHAPPALVTAFDNIGKLTSDQFTIRLEYQEQDIVRNVFKVLKAMSSHSEFQGRYAPLAGTTWDTLNPETIVFPSVSSARWLHELGKTMLSETAYLNFEATVTIGGAPVVIQATFPQLKIVPSRSAQIANLITWIGLLNPDLPNVRLLVAAGVFLVWDVLYFHRSTATLGQVEPRLAQTWAGGIVVSEFLVACGLRIVRPSLGRVVNNGWHQFMIDVHTMVSGYGKTTFDKFLRLTKQPDTQFGTLAQLLELDPNAWVDSSSRSAVDYIYRNQNSDMSATCLFKFNEKSVVTSALLFGFSKRVWYQNSQSARLNGSIPATRMAYLASDFLNVA